MGVFTSNGAAVTVTNPAWSRVIEPGASVTVGYNASHLGTVGPVADVRLNGVLCSTGGTDADDLADPDPATPTPTRTPTPTPTPHADADLHARRLEPAGAWSPRWTRSGATRRPPTRQPLRLPQLRLGPGHGQRRLSSTTASAGTPARRSAPPCATRSTPRCRASSRSGWTSWSGHNAWPYANVPVRVVGWAVRDRSQLQWTDTSVDIYVNNIRENAPQCAEPCGRFFHQDGNYSGCPGGAARHYDHVALADRGLRRRRRR